MEKILYSKALAAIMELFGDTTISQGETKALLEELIEEIEMLVDSLDD